MAITILGTSTKTDTRPIALKREVLVDSQADLASIPSDSAPGSIAYTADMKNMWMKDNDGSWKQIGA